MRRRGAMEPRDHYPDVLIAQSAGRIGAVVVTDNVADLRSWIRLGRRDATVPYPGDSAAHEQMKAKTIAVGPQHQAPGGLRGGEPRPAARPCA